MGKIWPFDYSVTFYVNSNQDGTRVASASCGHGINRLSIDKVYDSKISLESIYDELMYILGMKVKQLEIDNEARQS